jgi:acyl-CoA dehydrogenase
MDLTYPSDAEEFRTEIRDWLEANLPDGWFDEGFSMTPEEKAAFNDSWTTTLFEGGWICATWPEEYGGRGSTAMEWLIFEEEYYRAGGPQRVTQNGIFLLGPTLMEYGTAEQKARFLPRMATGDDVWCQGWSEPGAGSDMAAIRTTARRDGDHYVVNGRKWWSSGAGDPRCAIYIVMGKTDPEAPRHSQQSMIVIPANTPGVSVLRPLTVFGYDDAPHGHMEVVLKNVRVPASNLLLGEGRGFEIAQGRLGPGRIHHCMRTIGSAERALELMCKRLNSRVAFGKKISAQGVWHERIAESRIMIEQARLLTLKAAYMMDTVGNKIAKSEIAMIKVIAPNMALQIIDWAIQAHGAGGVSDDFPLAYAWAHQRTLRLADGPDEVHRNSIAKLELARHIALEPQEVEMPITRGS